MPWLRDAGMERALRTLFMDIEEHQPTRLTDALPRSYSAAKLKWLHGVACRHTKPTLDCLKFAQRPDKDPEILSANYVCKDCTHPVVPIRELQERLFGRSAEDMHDERLWRRYVNESAPMKPDQFRQIIANAWMNGWLGSWQTRAVWLEVSELQAAKLAIKRIISRAKERKDFVVKGELNFTEDELHQEFRVQLEKINEAGYQRFEKRQRSAAPLKLPEKFLAWVREQEPIMQQQMPPGADR